MDKHKAGINNSVVAPKSVGSMTNVSEHTIVFSILTDLILKRNRGRRAAEFEQRIFKFKVDTRIS